MSACSGAPGADEVGSRRAAVTFGSDDRKNVVEFTAFKDTMNWSATVAVLGVRTGADQMCLPTATQGYCYLNDRPLTQALPELGSGAKLCPGERFANERGLRGNCSAFYVGNGRFLTASHCVSDAVCKADNVEREAAFGYRIVSFSSETRKPVLPKRTHRNTNVFTCLKVVADDFDPVTGVDWAVFEVASQVPVHRTLRIRRAGAISGSLTTLGHGLGLPQKISTTGVVRSVDTTNRLFLYTGDAFNGDSGGPVVDPNTGRAVGLVTAVPPPLVGANFTYDSVGDCYRYAPPCDPVQGCSGPGIAFTRAMDLLASKIQSAVPEPPANPALYAHLDSDTTPDRVSLEATTLPPLYQVRVELSTGTTYVLPTLIPALVPPSDLSAFLHVYDFDGDGKTDILLNVDGFPPAYLDGAAIATLDPFSTAQALLQTNLYTSFSVGDINGDGLGDLRARTEAGHVSTFFGTPRSAARPGGPAPVIEIPHECGENTVSQFNRPLFSGHVQTEYRSTRAVAVVPGSSVGIADAKTLLVIDCPGETQISQLKYIDPRTGLVRKTQALSGPGQWRALAYRQSNGDLLALSHGSSATTPYRVSRIPLTSASSVSATLLFSRSTTGTATGIGWDGSSQRVRVLLDEANPKLETLAPGGSLVFVNPLPLAPYGQQIVVDRPKVAGLAVSGSTDVGVANGSFLGTYFNARSALIDWSSGGAVTLRVLDVHQDEPQQAPGQGTKNPDASIEADGSVRVRAERAGTGDGRVYHIRFEASDAQGASCTGVVQVCVPHHATGSCTDQGPLYSSTAPAGVAGCTMDDEDAQPCLTCLHRSCCSEVAACEADAACSTSEQQCMAECAQQGVAAGAAWSAAVAQCEPACGAAGKKVSKATRNLLACTGADRPAGCAAECVDGP